MLVTSSSVRPIPAQVRPTPPPGLRTPVSVPLLGSPIRLCPPRHLLEPFVSLDADLGEKPCDSWQAFCFGAHMPGKGKGSPISPTLELAAPSSQLKPPHPIRIALEAFGRRPKAETLEMYVCVCRSGIALPEGGSIRERERRNLRALREEVAALGGEPPREGGRGSLPRPEQIWEYHESGDVSHARWRRSKERDYCKDQPAPRRRPFRAESSRRRPS